jgi:phosphoribosylglycinamide formyltransferase-1
LGGGEIRLLVCNKPEAGALARAARLGVEARVVEPGSFPDRTAFFERIADEFARRNVSTVCLAGFLLRVEPNFLRRFPGRVLNIHPALLPKFGGPGFYGRRVHEAVLAAGEAESGCSVHVVDEEFDHGPVLSQARVPVLPGDTPESLAARVLEQEHRLFPRVVADFVSGRTTGGLR